MGHFLTFYLPKVLKKWKKTTGDIIILLMCTINDNHIMYGSWDMKRNRHNFCHLGLFLAFSLPKNLENLNFEKMKKTPGDIIILHKYIKDHDHMLYHSWDMALDRYNFYFSFWAIFYPFIPQQPKRSKLKKKTTPGDIIILHICTKNYD